MTVTHGSSAKSALVCCHASCRALLWHPAKRAPVSSGDEQHVEVCMMAETVVCIGAAVMSGRSILAVRQSKGHSLGGSWTIPWGRLENGESPAEAVIREIEEESGIIASVEGLLGVQELPEPWRGWFALLYLCRHVDGVATPDNRETDAAAYLSIGQLNSLDDPIEPWSDWFMRQVLKNEFTLVSASKPNPFDPEIGYV